MLQDFGFTSAIIAGGAIRDDFMEKEITDYDYFLQDPSCSVELSSVPTFNEETVFTKIFGTKDFEVVLDGTYGNNINKVFELRGDYGVYQLIYTQIAPIQHVEKYFDIGFCKAYCDGKKIRYTQDFLEDYRNKTFTIVGEDMTQTQFDYSLDYHVEKLHWKYPSYPIRIADHNKRLFDAYQKS